MQVIDGYSTKTYPEKNECYYLPVSRFIPIRLIHLKKLGIQPRPTIICFLSILSLIKFLFNKSLSKIKLSHQNREEMSGKHTENVINVQKTRFKMVC